MSCLHLQSKGNIWVGKWIRLSKLYASMASDHPSELRLKKSIFPSFYKVLGQRLYTNFSGVTFSPSLRNSFPNSHTPQNYDPLSGYERKLLSPIKSLRNKESNSSKEGITSMLPVITFPWFLPSLGGVACDPDIPDDEVVPVVTPFGA